MKYQRIFVIVIDSLGVGQCPNAYLFDDVGCNTLKSIVSHQKLNLPTLSKLGLFNLHHCSDELKRKEVYGYYQKQLEKSVGKDTLSGHLEMMGVEVKKPYLTFSEHGFPLELIQLLEKKCNHPILGNKAASGTEIIKELGEEAIKKNAMIVYTSADSVLQIAASEQHFGLEELYRCCKIAREICMEEKWRVARVIARPFIGEDANSFKRTSNRHDYALKPPMPTALNILKDHHYDVIGIGKINDIFDGEGITKSIKSKSSHEGMLQTIDICKEDFKGLCFVNLVDFDSNYGHRRDVYGYGKELEDFDQLLQQLLLELREDDLLILTSDHGNDPCFKGSDHTREQTFAIYYSKKHQGAGLLPLSHSFSNISASILDNFELELYDEMIGESNLPYLK